MRRGHLFLCVAAFFSLTVALHAFSTLIALLFEDGQDDAIPTCDIPQPDEDQYGNGTSLIPKIIHQTYINASIPEKWQEGQQACIDLHPDYEYMVSSSCSSCWNMKIDHLSQLWTDAKSREFIDTHFNWFLQTFDSYPHPIQRADAIRYFVLLHYGGIYLDLDDGCSRRLDPLLQYPAWVRMTVPTGISNDAMGSVPGHPFFDTVVHSLTHYNRNWMMPYITVMYSTGPLFLSVIWKEYMSTVVSTSEQVRILMPNEYSKGENPFFNISKGSSWHGEDAKTIFWMGKHWMLLTVTGFAIAGFLAAGLYYTCARCEKKEMNGKMMMPPRRISSGWLFGTTEKQTNAYYEEVGRMA